MHLMGCKFCRRYKKEIRYMSKALDKFRKATFTDQKLSSDKKKKIQETINKEMDKN